MTLKARVFGRARLESGRLTVRILTKSGWQEVFSVELETHRRRIARWPMVWDEIDRHLRRHGYERSTPVPVDEPEEGVEFAVAGWSQRAPRARYAAAGMEPDLVALTLPPTEVGEIRRALDALGTGLDDWSRRAVVSLTTGLDEADAVTVLLPADHAGSLWYLLGEADHWQRGLDDDSVRALESLAGHLERSRLVVGPLPHVRETLQTALHEALTRPGAEGLAARDELLGIVRRFADAHRTATAADDEEQRRLQAERTEPEQPGPPR
ncbi:hypothetical protein [Streptomyces sp. NPDC046909]|uniref:hypothetical protein n=1 Tax=Streptomyces sp. NPDC046909 TaxID=3155617 RepID=UPI003406D21D